MISFSIELIEYRHHYCWKKLDLRPEDIGLRLVVAGWIVEHIGLIAGDIDSIFVGIGLIVVVVDWTVEHIDLIAGASD